MVSKPYKYHYYVKGFPAVLCDRPLSMVTRTTDNPARVNCRVCLADPFLAGLDSGEPVPPQIRCDGTTLVLEFTDTELASIFRDWMEAREVTAGWPSFGSWHDGKRD